MIEHDNCTVSIRYWDCKNRTQRPALFCKKHKTFIQWISQYDADELIKEGMLVEEWDHSYNDWKWNRNAGNIDVLDIL